MPCSSQFADALAVTWRAYGNSRWVREGDWVVGRCYVAKESYGGRGVDWNGGYRCNASSVSLSCYHNFYYHYRI